jgi:site-specific recombinase XerD
LDRDGKGTIQLVLYQHQKKMSFYSGVKVTVKDWDDKEKKVRKSHKQASDLNLIIDTAKAKLTNIFVKYRLQDKEVTFELLKDEYDRPNTGFDYLEWLKEAIEARRGEVTDSTIEQFNAHRVKLQEFKKTVAFAELSEDLFANFNKHMKVKLKNESNTRWNTLKTHRTFINIAKRKGIVTMNPLDRMPVKRAQTDRVFLDNKEVKLLFDLYHKKTLVDTYQCILRHFLFSCYTGLRVSDLERIKLEDIVHNLLIVTPKKTKNSSGATIRIPLVPGALEMIADEAGTRTKGVIFKLFSEPRMRKYIKLIVAHAKISKKITWNSGRHTFATNFLKATNNLAALQKLLGHSNISMTMVYAHIMTDDLEREMDAFGKI